MKVLKTHQKIFAWLCIIRFERGTTRKTKISAMFFSLFILLIEISALILSILSAHKNGQLDDFRNLIYAIAEISGCGCMLHMSLTAYFVRHKFASVFKEMQLIYEGICIIQKVKYSSKKYNSQKKIIYFTKFFFKNHTSTNPDSTVEMKKYLDKANQRTELIITISVRKSVGGALIFSVLLVICNILYCFIKFGHIDTNHLVQPTKFL